jgi:tetratricopeptide (TPR) repeat protein
LDRYKDGPESVAQCCSELASPGNELKLTITNRLVEGYDHVGDVKSRQTSAIAWTGLEGASGRYEEMGASHEKVLQSRPRVFLEGSRSFSTNFDRHEDGSKDQLRSAFFVEAQPWLASPTSVKFKARLAKQDLHLHLKSASAVVLRFGHATLSDQDYWVLNQSGRHEEAIACYKKALQLNSDKHSPWYNLAYILTNLGRYEEAIAFYDKAIQDKSNDDSAWNNRGYALNSLGRYEEAIDSYDKALQFRPDKVSSWHNRGYALEALGRYEEAIDSYDKALAIEPQKSYIFYNKARCYALQFNLEEAIANLTQAIALSSAEYRELAKTDPDFDAIRDTTQFQGLVFG